MDGGTPDLLLRHADQSMYEAKQAGKNCFRLFNPAHQNQQQSNQATLKKIGKALASEQLTVFYQPQVDALLGKVVGMEALIRWNHPILGLLAPSEFLPLLENDDLIIEVGNWVINQALKQQVAWHRAGVNLTVSVNIAARQLHQDSLMAYLTDLKTIYGAQAMHHLTLEIVEATALEDVDHVANIITQCQALGVEVAIDDFGKGFSSLTHLQKLHVNTLKISKGLMAGLMNHAADQTLIKGVIGLAASFQLKLVAEGVETSEQVAMLMNLGCPTVQGFFVAHPMPPDQASAWLADFTPIPLVHPLTT
jgi:EAL domain-containing protein (putative c-di-GMP-specific phosphodiesterase class I)